MPTFKFNKLVRDKLPAIYDQLGQQVVSQRLVGAALLNAYRNKFIEEAGEMPLDGNREKIIQELVDIDQLKKDAQVLFNITNEELEAARQKKLEEKGGFTDGIFVETITLAENDEWVEYYRREPDKYEEL